MNLFNQSGLFLLFYSTFINQKTEKFYPVNQLYLLKNRFSFCVT